jgi:hypothetical protein
MPVSRRPRLRWIICLIVAAAALLGLLAGGAAVYLLRAEPDYWIANRRALASRRPEQTRAMADTFERRLRQWLGAVDADGGARLHVRLDELNAWLAVHGIDALRRMGAPGMDRLRDPMAAVQGGRLVLAGEARLGEAGQIVSLLLDVESREQGMLWMRVAQVRGGRLPLPKGAAGAAGAAGIARVAGGGGGESIDRLRQEAAERHRALVDEMTAGRLCDPRPLLDLFDAPRDVQLRELALKPDGLTVAVAVGVAVGVDVDRAMREAAQPASTRAATGR